MRIEVHSQDDGPTGPEVWIRVLSGTVVDWPEVRSKLDAEQWETLKDTNAVKPSPAASRPHAYYLGTLTEEDREEHGYPFEDFWVFKRNVTA